MSKQPPPAPTASAVGPCPTMSILKSEQEWSLPAQLGQLKTGKGGKGLLQIHLCAPTTFQGYGIEQNRIEFFFTIFFSAVIRLHDTDGMAKNV